MERLTDKELLMKDNCKDCIFENRKRPQKCSCCRRNRYLKDCYESEIMDRKREENGINSD